MPSQAWFWDKKDKALEAELQGKGYAGTLPNLNKKYEKLEYLDMLKKIKEETKRRRKMNNI